MKGPARLLLPAALLAAIGAHAQVPPPAPAASAPAPAASAPSSELRQLCAALPETPTDGRGLAQRAQCVLTGITPSTRRFAEARELAAKAMEQGEPTGGFALYLAFANDPANMYRRDGKADLEAYRKLGERPLSDRAEQVAAIEGLAFAAGKNHPGAGVLLASYFYETVAPQNVMRVRAMTGLLLRNGARNAPLEKMQREAAVIEKTAPATKASVRSFLDAYLPATTAALQGHAVQTAGTCDKATLKSVSASDIRNAEYLPLTGKMVEKTYLVKGEWMEFWTFDACGEDVPVKVGFIADGWGGAGITAAHNKGQ
ncbi:hypothetical protein WG902_06975 [Ramlibacter sp. PS3R-8]|uniref:hypothetical protein n=1 Tax=Ramlibacter sp. PS3R-8 TaxID=3133437 RepID=UPI0030AC7AFE